MGFLGPSLDELAKQEVNKKGKTNLISTKNTKPKLTFQQKTTLISFVVVCVIIIVIGGSILFTDFTRPKPDYKNFKIAMKDYLDENKDISDIIIKDYNSFKVIVNDTWYNSSEREKLRFCKNVHDSIYVYAHQYKLIYRDSDIVFVYFYDTSDIKVAEQSSIDSKILH